MTNWVRMNGKDVEWKVGVIFSKNEDGSGTTTWEVQSISPCGNFFCLTLPNKGNETNTFLQNYPCSGIKRCTYWFKENTIQKLDPMLKIIDKIKYLDKRFLDRQAKRVLT